MFAGLRKYRRIEEISSSPVFTQFSPYPQTPPVLSNYNIHPVENHGPMPRGIVRPTTFRNNFWQAPSDPPPPLEFMRFAKRGGS